MSAAGQFERAAAELVRSVMSGRSGKAINTLKSPAGKIATIQRAAWYDDVRTLTVTLERSAGLTSYMHVDAFGVWSGFPPRNSAAAQTLLLSGRNTSARMLRTSMRTAIDRLDSLRTSESSSAAAPGPGTQKKTSTTVRVVQPVGRFAAEVVKLENVSDDDVVMAVVSVTSGAALKKLKTQPGQLVVRVLKEGGAE